MEPAGFKSTAPFTEFLHWFSNNWEKVAMTLGVFGGVIFALAILILMTSTRGHERDTKGENYVKCLEVTLKHGGLSNAEMMCSHLRQK